jgi:hypothetical protein
MTFQLFIGSFPSSGRGGPREQKWAASLVEHGSTA